MTNHTVKGDPLVSYIPHSRESHLEWKSKRLSAKFRQWPNRIHVYSDTVRVVSFEWNDDGDDNDDGKLSGRNEGGSLKCGPSESR